MKNIYTSGFEKRTVGKKIPEKRIWTLYLQVITSYYPIYAGMRCAVKCSNVRVVSAAAVWAGSKGAGPPTVSNAHRVIIPVLFQLPRIRAPIRKRSREAIRKGLVTFAKASFTVSIVCALGVKGVGARNGQTIFSISGDFGLVFGRNWVAALWPIVAFWVVDSDAFVALFKGETRLVDRVQRFAISGQMFLFLTWPAVTSVLVHSVDEFLGSDFLSVFVD